MIQSKVHENPDKLASSDQQGNYELTQCPAYVTTTEKPHPQIMEDQSNMYEL